MKQRIERHCVSAVLVLACAAFPVSGSVRAQGEPRGESPELHLVPAEGRPAVVPMQRTRTHRWVTVSELERLAIARAKAEVRPKK